MFLRQNSLQKGGSEFWQQVLNCFLIEGRSILYSKKKYIESDIKRIETVKKMKKYFDEYVVDAAFGALSDFEWDFSGFYSIYLRLRQIKPDEDESSLTKEYTVMRQDMLTAITNCIKEYTAFPDGKMPLNMDKEAFCFDILPDYMDKRGYTEDAVILRGMKGTLSLFNKISKANGIAINTSIPERVVENFEIYMRNIEAFKRVKDEGSILDREFAEELTIYASADGYRFCMTGKGIDRYNQVIAGIITESGIQAIGYNGYAKEQNDHIRTDNLDIPRYSMAKQLYKQILTPKAKAFKVDAITSNEELLDALQTDIDSTFPVCEDIKNFFCEIVDVSPSVFVKGQKMHTISHAAFETHQALPDMLMKKMEREILQKNLPKKAEEKALDARIGIINKTTYSLFELAEIAGPQLLTGLAAKSEELFEEICSAKKNIEKSDIFACANIKQQQLYVRLVKNYVEAVSAYRRFVVTFISDGDTEASMLISKFADDLWINTKAERMIRNYVVKKYKDEVKKIPLCFDTPTKLNAAWLNLKQDGKLNKNKHTIIRMNGRYYFFTLADDARPVSFIPAEGAAAVQVYTSVKGQNATMIVPKFAFPKKLKAFFETNPGEILYVLTEKDGMTDHVVCTKETYDIYKKGLYTTTALKKGMVSEEQYKENLIKLLLYYKDVITHLQAWSDFNFSDIGNVERFSNAGEFVNYVNTKTIAMNWVDVSSAQIEELVDTGKALMFEIHSNHLYHPELHQNAQEKLFLSIFSDENMDNPNIILNGRPTIFFRPKVLDKKIAHTKGGQIVMKYDVNGNRLPDHVYQQLYHYYNGRLTKAQLTEDALKSLELVRHKDCPHNIIYRNRYTEDKFILTYTYTINKQVDTDTTGSILNEEVRQLEEQGQTNYLSIVRGVKHLLYYTLTDGTGKIIAESDLDKINGKDWMKILKDAGRKRQSDKQEWIYDTTVADIKERYISEAVGIIANIAVDNSAVILLEHINDRTRDKYSCLDNQIFGKFEDALIAKLGNFHIKGAMPNDPGGQTNPLQLAFESKFFRDHGIVKLQSAGYIRNMDIRSGFYNTFDFSDVNSVKKKREFLSKMEIVHAGTSIDCTFDYNDFKTYSLIGRSLWTIKIMGERTIYDPSVKKNQYHANIVEDLEKVFETAGVPFARGEIVNVSELKNDAVSLLFDAFRAVVQGHVRECSEVKTEYKVSPVTGDISRTPMRDIALMQFKKYKFLFDKESTEKGTSLWVESYQNEFADVI